MRRRTCCVRPPIRVGHTRRLRTTTRRRGHAQCVVPSMAHRSGTVCNCRQHNRTTEYRGCLRRRRDDSRNTGTAWSVSIPGASPVRGASPVYAHVGHIERVGRGAYLEGRPDTTTSGYGRGPACTSRPARKRVIPVARHDGPTDRRPTDRRERFSVSHLDRDTCPSLPAPSLPPR